MCKLAKLQESFTEKKKIKLLNRSDMPTSSAILKDFFLMSPSGETKN